MVSADKQSRFEFMVDKFQELVGKYDALSVMFQKYVESNNAALEVVKTLVKDVDSLKKSQESLSSKTDSQFNFLNDVMASHSRGLHQEGEKNAELKKSLENESEKHLRHIKSIADIKASFDDKVSKDLYHADMRELVSRNCAIKESIQNIGQDVTILTAKHKLHEASLNDVKQEQGNQFNEIKSIKGLFVEHERQCKSALQEHKQKMDRDLLTVASDTQKKIEALPKPEKVNLDDFKKELDRKIEPFQLDARNSNLRSQNSEMRIVLIEKKIEQLQLLLNKLQLQG